MRWATRLASMFAFFGVGFVMGKRLGSPIEVTVLPTVHYLGDFDGDDVLRRHQPPPGPPH